MSDTEIYGMVRESMADVRMRRPLEAIVTAGRTRRRHRRQRMAGIAVSGIAVGAALALGLPSASSTDGPPSAGRSSAGPGTVHVQLAGFTLDTKTNGTVQLTLSYDQLADPAVLQAELAKVGVRAKVTAGKVCRDPSHPDRSVDAVIKDLHPVDDSAKEGVWTIALKAIPAGTTLNIGLFPAKGAVAGHVISFTLVADDATATCGAAKLPLGHN